MGSKFVDVKLTGVGRVRDFYVGSASTGGSRGISIKTEAGTYFVEDIAGEGAGSQVGSQVIKSTLVDSGGGAFVVTMKIKQWKVDESDTSSESMAKKKQITTYAEANAECQVKEGVTPKCWLTRAGGAGK